MVETAIGQIDDPCPVHPLDELPFPMAVISEGTSDDQLTIGLERHRMNSTVRSITRPVSGVERIEGHVHGSFLSGEDPGHAPKHHDQQGFLQKHEMVPYYKLDEE